MNEVYEPNGERATWRERERERAREEILEAAAHVFARSGYDGAGMKEIAACAGISVGMLYNHFRGKEEIFRALVDRYVDGMHERGDSTCAGVDPPLDQIRCRIRSAIDFYGECRNLVLIYVRMNPVRLEMEAAGWERDTRGVIAGLLAEAMRRGDMAEDDPRAIAALIIGSVHKLLHMYVSEEREEAIHSIPDVIDRIILKPLERGRSDRCEEEGR